MAAVTIDSGEFPLMRNVDVSHQPSRSRVYTAWTRAFNYNVPEAVAHLADIIEDVYTFELWKDKYLETPEQFFERVGILGLDLEDPAEYIKALRKGDRDLIDRIIKRNRAKDLRKQGKSIREIAEETGQSKSSVHREVSRLDGTSRKRKQLNITQYTKPETAAAKIRATFGNDFALALGTLLVTA